VNLPTLESAVKDLTLLGDLRARFIALQQAMNAFSNTFRKLSDERQTAVFKEFEDAFTDWLTGGMPELATGAPAAPGTAGTKSAPAGAKVTPKDRGVGRAVKKWLYDNPGGGTLQTVYLGVKGKFDTVAINEKAQVQACLFRLRAGDTPLVTLTGDTYRGTARLRAAMAAEV
jgi:hypothetical protein